MQRRHSRQRDLFEEDYKPKDIPSAQRTILARLIEYLLVEAVADARQATRAKSRDEGGVRYE